MQSKKKRREYFLNNHYTQHPPQSQRSDADDETGEESEGGADGHPHVSRSGRRNAEVVAGVEAGEVPKQTVALCADVEGAESVGW